MLVSSVHFCDPPVSPCPYANAFWTGPPELQMVYGEDFSHADDVVAHELTHAVTENEANLFYYMQSGALNESYSDIFGETVDLTNSRGDDSAGVRWLLGEDLPGFPPVRNMMDPTALGDPGKMSDPQFVCGDPGGDAGGVHSNSGVPNHAFALMVDGGTYNGVTVTAIGLTKAGKIQYRALTNYLLSGSDFLDNNNLLRQSCTDLIGTSGITAADCTEVGDALTAVQMPNPWPCAPAQAAIPALCPAGQTVNTVFFDNFEAGFGNWAPLTLTGDNLWFGGNFFAISAPNHLWGNDDGNSVPDDSATFMRNPIALPPGARLQFSHSYGFDNDATTNFDGGIIQYSTNGGASWAQAGHLITAGAGYGGTIADGFGNPLAFFSAFVRDSWGYTASQLDLSTLAGQNVQFRFRIGTDNSFSDYGWFIDDFRIYTCSAPTPPVITIDDVAVTEGNTGTVPAVLVLRLSHATNLTVTVNLVTADGTATGGVDYVPTGGSISWPPGTTTVNAPLFVNGDTTSEANETFFLNLSSPVNATLGDNQGQVTINDDDPPLITIDDVAVVEGNSGTAPAVLTLRLSRATNQTVSVSLVTQNGTATGSVDYVPTGGSISWPPGTTTVNAPLSVNGDTVPEGNETFFLNLSNPVNGVFGDNQGEVRIMDDDLSKYYTLTPCRVADTRLAPGPSGGPALSVNQARNFPAAGLCGIPADAKAVAINLTVVGATDNGNLRAYAAGSPPVSSSVINFAANRTRANNAIVPLGTGGQMAVVLNLPGAGTAHFLFDVTGYFK